MASSAIGTACSRSINPSDAVIGDVPAPDDRDLASGDLAGVDVVGPKCSVMRSSRPASCLRRLARLSLRS